MGDIHAIERTSPKGQKFVGTCMKCGRPNLTLANMGEPCENIGGMSQDEALIAAIEGPPVVRIMEDVAQFLWALLDDIDTASDHAKGDDKAYREIVERIQRRRFEVGSTDGYAVTFRVVEEPRP